MIDCLLMPWKSVAKCDDYALVIPDGCRDLIYKSSPGEKPKWFLSDLELGTYEVPVFRGDIFRGYRLKPGIKISEEKLLIALKNIEFSHDNALSRLEDFTAFDHSLDQALSCLASGVDSVAEAARLLGGSVRTLHRLVLNGTGKSPVFWLRLARVRKAGLAVKNTNSLAEIAFDYGFSDQAHMSREFKKWLAITPSALRLGGAQSDQLCELGYT